MADIAGHENSGNAGFKVEWIPIGRPTRGTLPSSQQMLTGNDVTLGITLDDSAEPIRARNGPGVNEERTRRHGVLDARLVVLNGNFLALAGAFDSDDTRVEVH